MTFQETGPYTLDDPSFELAKLACQAVLYEATAFPKPGLVTPISTGAHGDMDYFTFINSTTALHKHFLLFAEAGRSHASPKEIFFNLREIGIQAEKAMFLATEGVNTHKGMIFLMGVTLAATAKVLFDRLDFLQIQIVIKEMTAGLVLEDLKHLTKETAKSHGEKLYIDHGITGVRGEVEAGLPTVFDDSLPYFEALEGVPLNKRLVLTLFKIMTVCDDTTIVHRKGVQKLVVVKALAKEILAIYESEPVRFEAKLEELEASFIKDRISPGGSADLLAVTTYLSFVQRDLFSVTNQLEDRDE